MARVFYELPIRGEKAAAPTAGVFLSALLLVSVCDQHGNRLLSAHTKEDGSHKKCPPF